MTYGVQPEGFVLKDRDTIIAELANDEVTAFGADTNTQADSVLGQLNGIFGDKIAELWQLAQAVYSSQYPDSADGVSLDNVSAITGVVRLAAEKSTFATANVPSNPLSVTLNAGVTVPAGSIVRVPNGPRFVLTTGATNSGGASASFSVDAESEETGPIVANAGTVTERVTPVSGWTAVTNSLDANIGRLEETDAELRARREELLRASGAGTMESIRDDVLSLDGVTACKIFENDTDYDTDGGWMPPHSFEVVALGGTEQAIVDQIWLSKPIGIQTQGNMSATVTDSQGVTHTVKYSRPNDVPIYVTVDVTVDDTFPADGSDQIKAALVAYGASIGIGDDVIWSALFPVVFSVQGVTDVTQLFAGIEPPGVTGNITIDARGLATFDTGNIVVNVTVG